MPGVWLSRRAGEHTHMATWIGTSGWHYSDWCGTVYPAQEPASLWFERYAERFDTVEINASSYRLPSEAVVQRWRLQAPDGFRYAAKGSRFTTHNLKIGGERLADSVALVTGRLRGLGDALAVILWQLPPSLRCDVDRLARFVGLLPGWVRHAVELRHPSWYDDRLHGLGEDAYRWDYTAEELQPWAEAVRSAAAAGLDAYAYFNNDHQGHAVRNAETFREMVAAG